jgi:hypothetical protein
MSDALTLTVHSNITQHECVGWDMKSLLRVTMIALSVFLSQRTEASIAFSPTVNYRASDDKSSASAESKTSVTAFDFRLGYILPLGILVGGTYAMESGTGVRSGGNETSLIGKRYGPSLGIVFDTLNFVGTYFMAGDYETKDGSTNYKYTEGTGYQLDLGWTWMLANKIGMGPNIVYKNLNYTKRTAVSTNTQSNSDYRVNEIYPNVAFWIML